MIRHMLRWTNPFKRKPKGYRFPNGIPRAKVTGKPVGGTITFGGVELPYDATAEEITAATGIPVVRGDDK